jgi:ankyrin repeat protein
LFGAQIFIALLFAMATSLAETKYPLDDANPENARLLDAASIGDLEGVKAAIEDGADPDYVSNGVFGQSALKVAAAHGYVDVIELLLKRGANINIVDEDGSTPLMYALLHENNNAVKILVANGADVRRAGGIWGHTPLHLAAMNGDPDIVKLLLERGARINVLNDRRVTPLDMASNMRVVDFLLSKGAAVSGFSADGENPLPAVDRDLLMAVVAGNVGRLRSALSRGAHVNIRDASQTTALIRAVYLGRFEVASVLLDNGADVNETDTDLPGLISGHDTPLHIAAGQGFPKLVELLITHHADLEARNIAKRTPLARAADAETATVLLRAGASASAAIDLLCGFGTGDAKLVEVLLSYGADANPRTGCITTPLLSAITHSHSDIAAVLLNHGADPNATGGSDSTPLTMAAGAGNAAIVTGLLGHGARANTPNKEGNTPLIEAARYGRIDVHQSVARQRSQPKYQGEKRVHCACHRPGYRDG